MSVAPGAAGGTEVRLSVNWREPVVGPSDTTSPHDLTDGRPSLDARRMWALDRLLTDRLAGAACAALVRAETLLRDPQPTQDRAALVAAVAAEVELATTELRSVVRRLRAWPDHGDARDDAPLEVMLRDAARRARVRLDLLVERGEIGDRRDLLVALAEELMFAVDPIEPAVLSVRFRRGGIRLRARLASGLPAIHAAIIEDLATEAGAVVTMRNTGLTGVEVQVELS